MILPSGYVAMTDAELVEALIVEIGYERQAAEFIVSVLNGASDVESPVM